MLALLNLCSSDTYHVMAVDLKYSWDAWAGARHTAKKKSLHKWGKVITWVGGREARRKNKLVA